MRTENTLSLRLRRYYKRVGKRVIFANGMGLNQLANAMAEKLQTNFDGATLSRAISGKRLFTMRQLRAFCSILQLSKDERMSLARTLAHHLLRRFHMQSSLLYKKHLYTKFLEFVIGEKHAYVDRLKSDISELQFVSDVVRRIENKMKKEYPKLWEKQKEALLSCALFKTNLACRQTGKPHFLLFGI